MSHDWSHRNYATIAYPPVAGVWPVVIDSEATCRKSLDGSLVLARWEGATPAPLAGATVYDHAAILTLLAGPDWTPPVDPPPP